MSIKPFVIDASVVGVWLLNNRISATSRALRIQGFKNTLYAPTLLHFEFSNLLCRRARQEGLVDFATPLAEFASWPIQFDDPKNASGEFAGIALEMDLTAYDASYLELAMRREIPLATMDKRLAKAARKLGIETLI